MGLELKRKSALKKEHDQITRRVLVGTSEKERRPLLEEVKRMARQATEEVPQTAHSLRRDHGISLPTLYPKWDLVPTFEPTVSRTIEAFEGNQSEVRVTLHLDELVDDTTTIQLDGLGISHLIGISISRENMTIWKSLDPGGMIAVIDSPVTTLPQLLHDVLLDMAMIHAKAQPWSGMRNQLNSHAIAALKALFIRERNPLNYPTYSATGECRYFPLAAFARKNNCGTLSFKDSFDLKSYVELWCKFAVFAKENSNIQLSVEREHLASQIIQSHVNGGQISISELKQQINQLAPGHYCLYFLIRGAATQAKVTNLCTFFQTSESHFRTQCWIIHPRDKNARQASIFLHERYISVFPFYIGGE